MNTPKHTPGPWTFESEDYSINKVRAPGCIIAQVIGDSAETEANAHLIAAAPAMAAEITFLRAALEKAKGDLSDIAEYSWDASVSISKKRLDEVSGMAGDALDAVSAALAKTEG